MGVNPDFEIIKEKKLDKETIVKISRNLTSGRIFVEFVSNNPRIVLQKNFQNNMDGKKKSESFLKSIKNTDQLREYFGIKKDKNES